MKTGSAAAKTRARPAGSRAPAGKAKAAKPPATPAPAEVVVEGQRYVVGEYGSLISIDEFERFITRRTQG